ncbi:hypothetical protein MBAV_005288 [Candidatus Magnetobacterium bavaricum]|uniref:Uncharacterized protein n=1 Tax=Candidatus Magnetobacterium bavaricum TaxID=29290 RepID=A0A0F3GKN3_9BACT|nr:hypothetical protein MBAV_005288 [Candidatus Magnetobacterium bavaricum]
MLGICLLSYGSYSSFVQKSQTRAKLGLLVSSKCTLSGSPGKPISIVPIKLLSIEKKHLGVFPPRR